MRWLSEAACVDDILSTTNPWVWAAGDVPGHAQFVYVAAHEGNLAARNASPAQTSRLTSEPCHA